MDDTANLYSSGKIATELKASPAKVKKAIAELKLTPAAKKGVCSYFTKADLARIKKAIG
jgi:hypothetical protein